MTTQYETSHRLPDGRRSARISAVTRKILVTIVRVVRDVNTANELLWDHHQRFDAKHETRALHWEPTTSGWRLYGDYLPRSD